MGIYPQTSNWTCGPFALKHALLALGKFVNEHEVSAEAHPEWWAGTDEVRLRHAASEFGCKLPLIRRRDPEEARKALVRYLQRGIPALLCVDKWEHWVAAVGVEGNRFVILDSMKAPVANVLPWSTVRRRWRYDRKEDGSDQVVPSFDLYPVIPSGRVWARARFSVERARYLRRHRELAENWYGYGADLMALCRTPSGRRKRGLSAAEFLRRHRGVLISEVAAWHGGVTRRDVERVLRHMGFVAEVYGLVVPEEDERRTLVALVVRLSLWACATAPPRDAAALRRVRRQIAACASRVGR